MTRVIMQPSFGRGAPREHWKLALANEIQFTAQPFADALRPGDRDRLIAMHPTGSSRFWGATKSQDKNYSIKMSSGDVVLFTGDRQVRAVGQVGVIFRNAAAFGDVLWDPHPKNGSWCNFYSVQNFRELAVPIEEVWALPGFGGRSNFPGLLPLDPDKSKTILEGLGIELLTVGAATASGIPDLDFGAGEGGVTLRSHLQRERDPKLRRRKIADVRLRSLPIACEVCHFDFAEKYSDRGADYIECHHRTPLHVTGQTQTRLADLALLCSNCYRMIHRTREWLTVEALKEIVDEQRRGRTTSMEY